MSQTKTLEVLVERAASWRDEAQAEPVRFMIDTEAKHFDAFRLDDDDRTRIEQSLAATDRGEFATEEEAPAAPVRPRTRASNSLRHLVAAEPGWQPSLEDYVGISIDPTRRCIRNDAIAGRVN